MRRFAIVVTVAVSLCSATAPAASITYAFASYPTLQNGNTIIGTITTNATLGPIVAADVTSWLILVQANGGFCVDSTSSVGVFTLTGNLIATPTQLELAAPTASTPNELLFGITEGLNITWIRHDQSLPSPPPDSYSATGFNSVNLFSLWQDISPGAALGGDPWVIATAVPEPASLVTMSLGLAGVAVLAWRRRVAA